MEQAFLCRRSSSSLAAPVTWKERLESPAAAAAAAASLSGVSARKREREKESQCLSRGAGAQAAWQAAWLMIAGTPVDQNNKQTHFPD